MKISGILWLADTEGTKCFVCKQGVKTVDQILLDFPGFKENFDSLWNKLKTKAKDLNTVDGDQIVNFITNLDQHHKMRLLLGSVRLPFDDITTKCIEGFVAAAVGKFTRFALKCCMTWGSMVNQIAS